MRKLALLIIMLVIVATSIGCGQMGLSEEKIRSIVREEVTKQTDSIDELKVSKLTIRNEDGEDVVVITSFANTQNGMILISGHQSEGAVVLMVGNSGDGELSIVNRNDEIIAALEASATGDGILCIGSREKRGAYLADTSEGGLLYLKDSHGNIAATMGISRGNGVLILTDEYGQTTFGAPTK